MAGPSAAAPSEPLQFDRWRELVAGGDDKVMTELARHKSPGDVGKELLRYKQEMSKRAQPLTLAKDATPEQIAEYRKALGVPDQGTVEAYGIKAPEGYEWTEIEKGALGEMTKALHEMHAPPAVAQRIATLLAETNGRLEKTQAEINQKRGREWTEARQQERGRDDKALLEASKTFLVNHEWVKGQENPQVALTEVLHAQLPGGGLLGDHPLFHALVADAALRGGYGDRIMANELESAGGKSLAVQQSEIQALRWTNKAAYDDAMKPGGKFDRIVQARVARGEIGEDGRERRRA